MKQYYIYMFLDPRKTEDLVIGDLLLKNEPFYVGKGSGTRDTDHLTSKGSRNPIFKAKIQKLKSLGLDPIIQRVEYFDDEAIAYQKEEYYIGQIGSNYISGIKDGPLTNYCLKACPPNHKGKTYQDIYGDKAEEQIELRRQKQIEAGGYFGGRIHSEQTKAIQRRKTQEYYAINAGPRLGTTQSEETRLQMSQSHKRRLTNRGIYIFTSSTGDEYLVLGFNQFCIDFNLSAGTLKKARNENWPPIRKGKCKGWSISKTYYPDESEIQILEQFRDTRSYLSINSDAEDKVNQIISKIKA